MTAELVVERVRERSVVTAARAAGPLRLLAPAASGHAAWVYQSSLGGGFVGGDDLGLRVRVADGAALFLSSQASSKVYRAARSRFVLEADVGEHATLVAWPDPVACFAGARFTQQQTFRIAASAQLVVVDAWTAGRVARGERWAFERFETRLALDIAGTRVLDDATLLDRAHGDLAARMAGVGAFATIVVVGPAADPLAAEIATRPLAWPLVTASRWPWGTIVRAAAATTEALALSVNALLRDVTIAALGADPWTRKW